MLIKLDGEGFYDENGIDCEVEEYLVVQLLENSDRKYNKEKKIVEVDFSRTSYAVLRKNEYPPIEEQLDMQYKDIINKTTLWIDKIAEIKAKYPKSS